MQTVWIVIDGKEVIGVFDSEGTANQCRDYDREHTKSETVKVIRAEVDHCQHERR